jgi:hypothetical protein
MKISVGYGRAENILYYMGRECKCPFAMGGPITNFPIDNGSTETTIYYRPISSAYSCIGISGIQCLFRHGYITLTIVLVVGVIVVVYTSTSQPRNLREAPARSPQCPLLLVVSILGWKSYSLNNERVLKYTHLPLSKANKRRLLFMPGLEDMPNLLNSLGVMF